MSPHAGTSQVDGWGFGNYRDARQLPGRHLACTWPTPLFVSLLTVVLTLLISLLGGYAFARFRFPGKNLLFLPTLAILMVPYATLLIPLYVLLNDRRAAELAGRGGAGAHDVPAAVLDVHDADLVRVDPARAGRGRDGRRLLVVRRAVAGAAAGGQARA